MYVISFSQLRVEMDCSNSPTGVPQQQFQAQDQPHSHQQQPMHQIPIEPRMQQLALVDTNVRCEFVCSTLYKNTGVILQFINNASVGSGTAIGGLRLKMTDITQVPAYLSRFKLNVKKEGIRILQRHLMDTQCPIGLGESLNADDYGISFTVATLTQRAGVLHPHERNEGPLWYCLFPGLVEPVYLRYNEHGGMDSAYILNAYITLLEPGKRRSFLAIRLQQEDAARREELALQYQQSQSAAGPSNKKSKVTVTTGRKPYVPQHNYVQKPSAAQESLLAHIAEGVDRMERQGAVPVPYYPPLPEPKPWPPGADDDSAMNLPADLK